MIEKFYVGLPDGVEVAGSRDCRCEQCCSHMRIMQCQLTLRENEGGKLICASCAIVQASSPDHENLFMGVDADGTQTPHKGGWFKSYMELQNKEPITLDEIPDMPEGMMPAMMLPSHWRAGYADRDCFRCGETVYADPADIAAVERKYPECAFVCESCGHEIYSTQQEGEHRSEFYRIEPARGCNNN